MCNQNTSKFDPNVDPCVIKIHQRSNKMWLLKCARSSAFVSFRQLWSALVGLGPLRSAAVGFGKSWSVLVDFDRNSCLNFLFRSRSNFLINPNFDPYVIKIHRNSNQMLLLKRAQSFAFVSLRQLWSALVSRDPLRSAAVGFGKSWSVLVDVD